MGALIICETCTGNVYAKEEIFINILQKENKIERLNDTLEHQDNELLTKEKQITDNIEKIDALNQTVKAKQTAIINLKITQEDILKQKNDEIERLNKLLKTIQSELNDKEKQISQLNVTKKESTTNTPTETYKTKGHEGGTAGLRNLGNTCYMNSIIQCTAHLPKLIQYFNNNTFKGNVCRSFQEIIIKIWNNDRRSMPHSLKRFKSEMSSVSTIYGSYNEQDPAEFLDYLMSVLHQELNITSDKYANDDVIVANGIPDAMVSMLSWTVYLKKNNSQIIDLFYGQHKSSVKCANKQCGYEYVIFEPFKTLALSTILPKKRHNYRNKSNTIYDCMDQYVQKNILYDSKWFCSKCKQDLPNSIEQIELYKFPKILIINLKKVEMQSVGKQPFIHYPVNGLDFTKYDISCTNKKQIYDLFAVSCLSGHHCIAYAKNHIKKQWYCFNDSTVTAVNEKQVVVQDAYLLFYENRE